MVNIYGTVYIYIAHLDPEMYKFLVLIYQKLLYNAGYVSEILKDLYIQQRIYTRVQVPSTRMSSGKNEEIFILCFRPILIF